MFNVEQLMVGDVLCSKSMSFVSRAIGWSFDTAPNLPWAMTPNLPHSHDGLLYIDESGDHFVFEAILGGLTLTPIRDYVEACKRGDNEVFWLRVPGGLTHEEQAAMLAFMRRKLNERIPYDYWSYISHVWRYALKLAPLVDTSRESHYYCTEACQAAYTAINYDVWNKKLPAPITTEKRYSEKLFEIFAHWMEI